MKKYIVIISIFVTILISLFISIFFIKRDDILHFIDKNIKGEIQKDITYQYYGWGDGKAEVLVSFTDTEDGISKVETPNDGIIELKEKNKFALDYAMDLNETYIFKMYNTDGEVFEKEILLDMNIIIYKLDDGYGYKKIAIEYINPTTESYTKQYKIGKNGTWTTYVDGFFVWDYDVTYQQLLNDDETVTVYGKLVSQNGNIYEESMEFDVDTTISAKVKEMEADSLIEAVKSEDYSMGIFNITVNNEKYDVHAYEFQESQNFDFSPNFGIADDVATANRNAKRMVIVKVNGDLTIEQGKTLTAYKNSYGGPKGMLIYVTGKLVNNGTISMTARGAKANGQNVYLWKNTNESYEYVPAIGALGGDSISVAANKTLAVNGNPGKNGTNRQTGGGGTGAGRNWFDAGGIKIGTGGRGTSYSGGVGSGAANSDGSGGKYVASENASSIGGAGGQGLVKSGNSSDYGQISIGGTGNPSGGYQNYKVDPVNYVKREGTGGLLILYSDELLNKGTINSNGVSSSTTGRSKDYSRVDTGGASRRRKC